MFEMTYLMITAMAAVVVIGGGGCHRLDGCLCPLQAA